MIFTLYTCLFLGWVAIGLPVLAFYSYIRLKRGVPLSSKPKRYLMTATSLTITLALGDAAATENGIPLWRQATPSAPDWMLGAMVLAAAIHGVVKGWRRAPEAKKARVRLLFMPETRGQEVAWAGISLLAGVAEEFAYRGALWALLTRALGTAVGAAAVCIVVFALAHATQGLKAVLGIGYLGLLFHLMVWWSGTLLVVVAVHAIYDFVFVMLAKRMDQRASVARAQEPAAAGPEG